MNALKSLKLRQADSRYYVSIAGQQVGWVLKDSSGPSPWWLFYATVNDSIKGTLLASSPTRREALMDGLSTLRFHHLGRVSHWNWDTHQEEWFFFDDADLRDIQDALLAQKYPLLYPASPKPRGES